MNIFGASGHAKVVIECLEAVNIEIDAIFDDDENKNTILEYQIHGKYNPNQNRDMLLIVAIGDNKIRQKVTKLISHSYGKIIHPSAIVSKRSSIDEGSVVFHNSVIQSSCVIGKHVIINTNASVDHDCIIHDFVHIAPNATLCGGVVVGKRTLIGAGAVVLPSIIIGENCIIGAGSVVRRDIPDDSIVIETNRSQKIK
jgi:sugar O-acyltransferase (sialic acid O-acetyltransferase NeuD family)